MPQAFQFRDRDLVLEEIGPQIAEAQIEREIPDLFPGKEDFVSFYIKYNGICFRPSALFFRSRGRKVEKNDHDRLEVEYFYFIPRFEGDDHDYLVSMVHVRNNLMKHRPDLYSFAINHLPIACDASGNEFWIKLETGEVEYAPLELFVSETDLIDVAPTFYDFVDGLESRKNSE